MRSMMLGAVVAAVALACGRGEQAGQTGGGQRDTMPPTGAAPAGGAQGGGQVVEIRMTGNGRDRAAYEPAQVTVQPGTTLRFVNVSGGPHNVAFWADSIPQGAAEPLNAAMPSRQGNLTSPMLVQPNQTYEFAFPQGAPRGTYKGYCTPHLMMGMKIAVTVQ
jgi:plastocyanin